MLFLFWCGAAFALAPALGCSKSSDRAVSAESAAAQDAFVEQHDTAAVAWVVTGDGKAHAVVLGMDGKPVRGELEGSLTWNGRTIPMKQDEGTGALEAEGPTLEGDITQIGYVISLDGGKKTLKGTLHLPRGGTKELAETSRAAAKVKVAKIGPHGGRVQMVGDDRVEVVANPSGGEIRVYVLDADLKPEPIENRRITVGVVSDKSEVIVLAPGPKAEYATGRLVGVVDPVKLTVGVSVGVQTHVALVDYEPGVFVLVGAEAPHIRIFVRGGFWVGAAVLVGDDDDDDDHHHHHHTNIHVKGGKHGHVHINAH